MQRLVSKESATKRRSDHEGYLTFHSAGKFPNRVGMPNRSASKFTSSVGVRVGYVVAVIPGILDAGSMLRLMTGAVGGLEREGRTGI
jgi:hypothetical protein